MSVISVKSDVHPIMFVVKTYQICNSTECKLYLGKLNKKRKSPHGDMLISSPEPKAHKVSL